METYEKRRNDNLISTIWQLTLWCCIFLSIGIFFVGGFYDNVGCRVGSITILARLFFSYVDMPYCSYYIEKK